MLFVARHRIIKAALFLLTALCALFVPAVIRQRSLMARYDGHRKLSADIYALRIELDRYKAANGGYPTTEQGLRMLGSTRKDPWGHDYIYRAPGIPHGDP